MKSLARRAIWKIVVVIVVTVAAWRVSGGVVMADAPARLEGRVVDGQGLPVAGATAVVIRNDRTIATTTTDRSGAFRFAALPAGFVVLDVSAQGFRTARFENVVLAPGVTLATDTVLSRARTNGDATIEIGRTSTVRMPGTLAASATTIAYDLDPLQLQEQGVVRAVDALTTLPGVNINGGPNSRGDDTFIDIRGAGPSETRTLLDGHPIGPGGAIPLNSSNTQSYVYDFANSPFALMDDVRVTVGSGATGLYGVNAIGGTIDFRTLEPTKIPHASIDQLAGEDGTRATVAKVTASSGPLGVALGYAVNGSYNDFAPTTIFQSARPNNDLNLPNGGACVAGTFDLTSCNQALNTYPVSGNYFVASALAKMRYTFLPSTSITLTAYSSNERSDATGNADNDAVPYATRLAAIEGSGTAGTGGCGPGLYPVVTDANPNACDTAQQWAAASSGPDGSGAQRSLAVQLGDYDVRATAGIGLSTLVVDAYQDFYRYANFSSAAAGLDPTGTFTVGSSYSNVAYTSGVQISDDIAGRSNEFGFGWATYHQLGTGNSYAVDANFQNPAWTTNPAASSGQWSAFVRDAYTPDAGISAFFNAWLTRSTVTNQTTFDPRLSLVYKPTPRDAVRLTGGRTDGFPNAALTSGGVMPIGANLSNLQSLCPLPGSYGIASVSNPALGSESATDVEAAYSHRFGGDSTFNVVGFVSSERQQLFQITVPLASAPAAVVDSPVIQGLLAQYAPKITSNCGLSTPLDATTVQQYLGVLTTINIATALYRGIEVQGRVRASRHVYLDYSYQLDTAQQFGIPVSVLENAASAFVINGAQIYEFPSQKGSLTIDVQPSPALEAQLAGYYTGKNNTYNRPPFTYFNAFVSKRFSPRAQVVLSASNVFDQNVQRYQYFGQQVLAPTNQYFSYASAIAQANGLGYSTQTELIGLQPRVISVMLKLRI